MKKLLIILFINLLFLQVQAQQNNCGTLPNISNVVAFREKILNQVSKSSINTDTIITYIPVKLHLTKNSSGTTNFYPLDLINIDFARLNQAFLPAKVQFYLVGTIDYITDDFMDDFIGFDSYKERVNAFNVNNAINVYYINNAYGIGGLSNFPTGDLKDNWLFVRNYVWQNGETLVHEMGHYFNLFHTFETYSGKELVTRGLNANCYDAGDLLCDTPADDNSDWDPLTCSYEGTGVDSNGEHYNPLMDNFMSYYTTCYKNFTTEQIETIQWLSSYFSNVFDFSAPVTNMAAASGVSAAFDEGRMVVSWTDNSSTETGYFVERSTNPSTGFVTVGGVSTNVTTFYDYEVSRGVEYYYRVSPSNNTTLYSSPSAKVIALQQPYCIARSYADYYDYIKNITIKDSSNIEIFNNPSYKGNTFSDFSNLRVNVIAGKTYHFQVLVNSLRSDYSFVYTWIDINRNGIFEEIELVSSVRSVKNFFFDIPYTIPLNTTPGSLRIRFRQEIYPFYPQLTSCLKGVYGETEDYTLVVSCPTPSTVNIDNTNICSGSNVSLTANCPTGTVNWYNQSSGGVTLGTGSPFIHSPSSNTTYYASCVSGCESSRVATNQVIVNLVSAPTITPPPSLSVCSPATLTLTASGCDGMVTWSQGAATGTNLTLSAVGTYSITATCTVNGCTSAPSAAVTGLEIKAKPNVPTVFRSLRLPSPDCIPITLTASGCNGTITWSEGAATGSSFTPAAGTYAVSATCSENGCISDISSVIRFVKPAAPTNVNIDNANVCYGSTVTLAASCESTNSIIWYSQATNGVMIGAGSPVSPIPLSNISYYVSCHNGMNECSERVATSPVNITNPNNRLILLKETFDGATFPNGWLRRDVDGLPTVNGSWGWRLGFVGYNNSAISSGNLRENFMFWNLKKSDDWMWTPLISGITTNTKLKWKNLYDERDSNNLGDYEVRIMTGTNGPPTGGHQDIGNQLINSTLLFNMKANNYSENREVSLANYAGQSVYVGFRNNFYGIQRDGEYYNLVIDDVIVEDDTLAPTVVTTNVNEICGNNSVILTANCRNGTINWYNQATDGVVLGTGSPFTHSPHQTTTYYASCVGVCESNRVATNQVIVNSIPTNVSISNTSVCRGSSVILNATCEIGTTVNWYSTSSETSDVIGTGTGFITVPLTKTTYYATCETPNCRSERVATSEVSINTLPDAPINVNIDNTNICSGTTITLRATCGPKGQLTWYNQATGGVSIGTGSPFSHLPLSNITYYAVCVDNCESERVATSVTVKNLTNILFMETFSGVSFPNGWFLRNVDNLTPTNPFLFYDSWIINTYLGDGAISNSSYSSYGGVADDWMWTPLISGITTNTKLRWKAQASNYSGYEVRVMTGTNGPPSGGIGIMGNQLANSTQVFSINAEYNQWITREINLADYAGQSIYIGFRNNTYDNGTGGYLAIDDIIIEDLLVPPTGVIANVNEICENGTVTLNANCPTGTVNWHNQATGGVILGTGSPFVIVPNTITTYYASCDNVCQSSRVATNQVIALVITPTITTPPSLSVCSPATLTLTASGCAGTVTWSQGAATGTILTLSSAGTYNITATCTVNGCTSAPSTAVTGLEIKAKPNAPIITNLSGYLVCLPTMVTLTASGCAGTVTWSQGAATGTSLIISTVGEYSISATCNNECFTSVASSVTNFVIQRPPVIPTNVSVDNTINCSGSSVTLTATCDNSQDVIWIVEHENKAFGYNIQIGSGSPYKHIPLGNATYYARCANGCGISDRVTTSPVTVYPVKVTLFNDNFNSFPNNWFIRNVDVLYSGNPNGWAVSSGPGYKIASSDAFGGQADDWMWTPLIRVITKKTILKWSAFASKFLTSYEVRVMVATNGPPTGGLGVMGNQLENSTMIYFNNNEYFLGDNRGNNREVSLNDFAGQSVYIGFRNISNNTDGYLNIGNIVVEALLEPPILVTANVNELCGNSPVTLTANCPTGKINWYNQAEGGVSLGTGSPFMHTPNQTTTYYASCGNDMCQTNRAATNQVSVNLIPTAPNITPPAGLSTCSPTTLILTANGCAGTVTWSQGAATGTSLTLSAIGTYSITATCTVNGCTSAPSAAITGLEIKATNSPTITPPSSLSVCSPATLTLTASGCEGTVTWSQGGATGTSLTLSSAGSYNITTTCTVNGCTSAPSTAVTGLEIKAKPNAPTITPPASLSVCSPTTLTLTASGCEGMVTWSQGTTTGTSLTLSDVGTYSITATCSVNGCTSEPSAAVTGLEIKAKPNTPTITPPSSLSVCSPATLTLTTSGCAGTVTWSQGAATGTSLTLSAIGTYSITATCTVNGCSSTSSAAVTGLEIKAKPSITASNTGPYTVGQTINLNGIGSGTFSWTGPNSFSSSLTNPVISNALLINAGVYTLAVVGTNGCQTTATTNVVIGSIDECNTSRIVDYLYVKAGNPYQPMFQLTNGMIINQITEKVSILINPVCPSATIESFEMSIQGPELNWSIIHNVAPYGLFDNFGLEGKYFTPGNYTLTVTGYAQDNKGGGIKYGPKIITFVVVGYLATINTPSLSKTTICAGNSVDIAFSTTGNFNNANQFQIELSDSLGSFERPILIGTTHAIGTINCIIPHNTPEGTNYRIRVISSNQVVVSNPAISPITVYPLTHSLIGPNNNLTGIIFKKAVNTINARNKIISPANVIYQAGKTIILTPGFESNAVFKAEIKACSN